jgi:hypothetical protein
MTAAGTSGRDEPLVQHAERAGDAFGPGIDRCVAMLRSDSALHHVAHYTGRSLDFTVDLLDAERPRGPGGDAGARLRDECQRVGRHLTFQLDDLNRDLAGVRSGALIRTVLQGREGTVFGFSVVPRQYLIGVRFEESPTDPSRSPLSEHPAGRKADRAMAETVSALRATVRLLPQNAGGWLTEDPASGQSDSSVPGLAPDDDAEPHTSGDSDDWAAMVGRRYVRPAGLQYTASFRNDQVVFTLDVLDDERLAPFFTQITVPARREFYANLGREFSSIAGQLGRIVRPVTGGQLDRVVLDVEQGAMYFYRLGPAEHLLGVTVDQSAVSQADDSMARLTVELSRQVRPTRR